MLPIQTPRLLLRPLIPTDADAIVALLSADPDGVGMTIAIRWPVTREDTLAWIASPRSPGIADLCVEEMATHQLAGCISGRFTGTSVRIGYWIGQPFRRRGYASEAARALLVEARRQGCLTAKSDVFQSNAASAGVLEGLGFRQIAASQQHFPLRGSRHVRHFALDLTRN